MEWDAAAAKIEPPTHKARDARKRSFVFCGSCHPHSQIPSCGDLLMHGDQPGVGQRTIASGGWDPLAWPCATWPAQRRLPSSGGSTRQPRPSRSINSDMLSGRAQSCLIHSICRRTVQEQHSRPRVAAGLALQQARGGMQVTLNSKPHMDMRGRES